MILFFLRKLFSTELYGFAHQTLNLTGEFYFCGIAISTQGWGSPKPRIDFESAWNREYPLPRQILLLPISFIIQQHIILVTLSYYSSKCQHNIGSTGYRSDGLHYGLFRQSYFAIYYNIDLSQYHEHFYHSMWYYFSSRSLFLCFLIRLIFHNLSPLCQRGRDYRSFAPKDYLLSPLPEYLLLPIICYCRLFVIADYLLLPLPDVICYFP